MDERREHMEFVGRQMGNGAELEHRRWQHEIHRSVESSRAWWRNMTEDEFKSWYPTSADRCQLELGWGVDRDFSRSACSNHRKKNVSPRTLQCGVDSYGVGLGYKHICVPPMSRRTYFKSVLVGYENARVDYLGALLKFLAKKNKALVLLGDSLSYQTISIINCELYREQIVFTKGGDPSIPLEGKGVYTYYFQDINASVDVYYKRLDNIRLEHQYKHLRDNLIEILDKRAGFVILANIGLNYNTMQDYREDVPKFFDSMNRLAVEFGGRIQVIWRETTAAHWSYSDNGYYSGVKRANMSKDELFCAPHSGMGFNIDPRNEIVLDVLKNTHRNKFDHVNYIPFYFATVDLWNMHTDFPPYPGGHADCVHYCYHPVLWQPVWRYLYDIIVLNISLVIK